MSLNYVDRSNDEEIIDIVRSIFTEGNMEVETLNEAILVALMKKRGTPITVSKSWRDIEKDYAEWVSYREGVAVDD